MWSQIMLSVGLCDQFSEDHFAISLIESVRLMLSFGNCNQISLTQSDHIKRHLLLLEINKKIYCNISINIYIKLTLKKKNSENLKC